MFDLPDRVWNGLDPRQFDSNLAGPGVGVDRFALDSRDGAAIVVAIPHRFPTAVHLVAFYSYRRKLAHTREGGARFPARMRTMH